MNKEIVQIKFKLPHQYLYILKSCKTEIELSNQKVKGNTQQKASIKKIKFHRTRMRNSLFSYKKERKKVTHKNILESMTTPEKNTCGYIVGVMTIILQTIDVNSMSSELL
jgi:hypothetical protein